jgi:hypothetical protein
MSDAAGEGLGNPSNQSGRSAPGDEKSRLRSGAIGKHPENWEQLGTALRLVEDHQTFEAIQCAARVGQAGQGSDIFKVEKVTWRFPGQGPGQGGLADLPWSEQGYNRESGQPVAKSREIVGPLNHSIASSLKR